MPGCGTVGRYGHQTCRHRLLHPLRRLEIAQGVQMVVVADRLPRLAVRMMLMTSPNMLALLAQALRQGPRWPPSRGPRGNEQELTEGRQAPD